MTVIGFLIGMAVFLILGYFCLMLVFVPYIWFKAYLELEDRKAKENRDAYQKRLQGLENPEGRDTGWSTPYEESKRKGIRRITENELVAESLEWLLSWGIFLALEGFWVYSLYKGFESAMQNVGDFLEAIFSAE